MLNSDSNLEVARGIKDLRKSVGDKVKRKRNLLLI